MARPTAAERAIDSRVSISKAAIRLFVSQGYEATTVAQIARQAGLSRATVFRHFPSKEDILFHRFERELRQLCAGVQDRRGSDRQRIRGVLLEFAGQLQADAEAFRIELRLITESPTLRARALVTLDGWAQRLARELSAGRDGDADLPARVLAHSGVAALQEAICLWRSADTGTRLEDLVADALQVILPRRRKA